MRDKSLLLAQLGGVEALVDLPNGLLAVHQADDQRLEVLAVDHSVLLRIASREEPAEKRNEVRVDQGEVPSRDFHHVVDFDLQAELFAQKVQQLVELEDASLRKNWAKTRSEILESRKNYSFICWNFSLSSKVTRAFRLGLTQAQNLLRDLGEAAAEPHRQEGVEFCPIGHLHSHLLLEQVTLKHHRD